MAERCARRTLPRAGGESIPPDLEVHAEWPGGGTTLRLTAATGRGELYDGHVGLRVRTRRGVSTGEDLLTFQVHNHGKPDIDAPGMKYGGRRYRVQAHLAGKLYGDPFGVDVAFGEPIFGAPDRVRGRTDLSFIGMEAPELTVYPRLTHIAEKLHAYTVPRPSPNSRVRDIPDLALLAGLEGAIDATDLRSALVQTFEHRATHALPERVPSVPARWAAPYAAMAEANLLPWKTLAEVERAVVGFLDPALAGGAGSWSADRWAWSEAG